MALLTHSPPSLPPPSPSRKFTVARLATQAPDPYSKLLMYHPGGNHEHIERVNKYVAHKSVKVSQGALTDTALTLWICVFSVQYT